MSLLNSSINNFLKIAPYIRNFLLFYVILAVLPIHTYTGSNIQSIVADGLMGNRIINPNISRILWVVLFVFGFITKDFMIISGLIFFVFWDSDKNKDKTDQGRRYV
jgi:hypothetical protein